MTAAAAKSAPKASSGGSKGRGVFQDKEKPQHVSYWWLMNYESLSYSDQIE